MAVEPRTGENWPRPVTKADRLKQWQQGRSQQDRQQYTEAQQARLRELHAMELEETAKKLQREDELENMRREAMGLPPVEQ